MKDQLSIKIGGQAGQGVKTLGFILTKALKRHGWWTFSYSEYPSLIRGGHSTFQIDIQTEKTKSVNSNIDILIALNKETIDKHYKEISKKGKILCDDNLEFDSKVKKHLKDENIEIITVTVDEIVKQNKGTRVMNNSVFAGSVWALITDEYSPLEKQLKETFSNKEKDTETNMNCASSGFEYLAGYKDKYKLPRRSGSSKRIIGTGNEIAGLSTYASGCRVYCAYPMTPSTGILHYLAQRTKETKMVVKQAEDEITAIQMAIGASFSGTRAACGTSGGGLALMSESLSLVGMLELPLVVFNSQRPGPATGVPTWTEQGDLSFVSRIGHGDYPKIIVAPGDLDEVFELTSEAFNLADRYQTLVIVLLDKFISESWYQTEVLTNGPIKVKRGKLLDKADLKDKSNFKRYKLTVSGISARSLPGAKNGVYLANSDEHDEIGYSTENLFLRKEMMDKRMRKLDEIKANLPKPELIGPKDAKTTLICWGSQKGPVTDASKVLNAQGYPVNVLHFSHVYPIEESVLKRLSKKNKLISIENNFSSQFSRLIQAETGILIENRIKKYVGTPFFRDELVSILKRKIVK